jgi:cytidylate kinase
MAEIPVIAVDGPSGSGKGVVCQYLAGHFGFHLLDSGALYRLVGLAARRSGIHLDSNALDVKALDEAALTALAAGMDVTFRVTGDPEEPLRILLDKEDVTLELRSNEAGVDASTVAQFTGVRNALFELQRSARQAPGLVADGRDMGTVVFPDADVKIFLTASAEARAERRYNQLKHKDISVSLHDLFLSIQSRDERDTNREVSPLRPAEDAFVIDSTEIGIEEVLAEVLRIVTEKLG